MSVTEQLGRQLRDGCSGACVKRGKKAFAAANASTMKRKCSSDITALLSRAELNEQSCVEVRADGETSFFPP